MKKKRLNSVLGLAFDGSYLEGIVLRRTNGSAEVAAQFSANLNLGILGAETDLVAQEIRGHLDKAEIRERNCVVCLPLSWVMTLQTKVPDLPPADVASFLQIEAERGFSASPENLSIVSFPYALGAGEAYATQVAIPNEHLVKLEAVLRSARLVPVAFSLGLPVLEAPDRGSAEGVVALEVGQASLGLQVTTRHGLLALRTLNEVLEEEDGKKRLNVPTLYRELRISLGQLQPEVRAGLRRVRVYGTGSLLDGVMSDLTTRADSLGLTTERVTQLSQEFGVKLPRNAPPNAALALAAQYLGGRGSPPDFLPPKVSGWNRFAARYSAKKLLYGAAVIALVGLAVVGGFTVQQLELSQLRQKWAAMDRKVRELDEIQQNIKQFRPWFDESFRSLSILKRLTEAFPDEGSVTAKTIEVREASVVGCTGTARDRQALYKTLDHLRSAAQVSEIKVDQEKGAAPVQFSFNFQWGEKGQP